MKTSNADHNDRELTVFYDGGCPLCRREIQHYRKMRGADRLEWVDISRQTETLWEHGISHAQAMARFHVREANGRWHTGAWGFAALWRQLPSLRWLAVTLDWLRLLPILDRVYTLFARRRLKRRCRDGLCSS